MQALIVLFFLSLFYVCLGCAQKVELPLTFHRVSSVNIKAIRERNLNINGKVRLTEPRRYDHGPEALNPQHSFITTSVGIGTPPDEFNVMLDLEGNHLWVLGSRYNYLVEGQKIYSVNHSNTSDTTGATSFQQDDETFTAIGDLYKDNVKIGNVTLEDQKFGHIIQFGEPDNRLFPFDGTLGLNLWSGDSSTALKNLMFQLNTHIFSLEFNDKHNISNGGILTIGGTKHCNLAPVQHLVFSFFDSQYNLLIAGVQYPAKNYVSSNGGNSLKINPTTSHTVLKSSDLTAIFSNTSIHFDSEIGLYTIGCDKKNELKTFYFNFNDGASIAVDLQYSVLDLGLAGNVCAIGLGISDNPRVDYVLGNILLLQGNRLTFDGKSKSVMIC